MTRRESQAGSTFRHVRHKPSLFEVMHKAPPQPAAHRARLLPQSKRLVPARAAIPVAEPLTEEEAARLLAEQRANAEQRRLAEQARRDAKIAAREAAKAAKLARREARARARAVALTAAMPPGDPTKTPARPPLALSTGTLIGLTGLALAVAISAYVVGKRSNGSSARIPPAAAVGQLPYNSPLLPATQAPKANGRSEVTKAPVTAGPRSENSLSPDLRKLLDEPPARAISANQPARVDAPEGSAAADRPENLNYLQIESLMITRQRSGDQVAADVAHVRHFLNTKGIATFARKRSNGYVLFAEQGFHPGKQFANERETFARSIRRLGREYRKSGGLYEFKGCFFVSHKATRAGDPV